jgi:hypothetical protein
MSLLRYRAEPGAATLRLLVLFLLPAKGLRQRAGFVFDSLAV